MRQPAHVLVAVEQLGPVGAEHRGARRLEPDDRGAGADLVAQHPHRAATAPRPAMSSWPVEIQVRPQHTGWVRHAHLEAGVLQHERPRPGRCRGGSALVNVSGHSSTGPRVRPAAGGPLVGWGRRFHHRMNGSGGERRAAVARARCRRAACSEPARAAALGDGVDQARAARPATCASNGSQPIE